MLWSCFCTTGGERRYGEHAISGLVIVIPRRDMNITQDPG